MCWDNRKKKCAFWMLNLLVCLPWVGFGVCLMDMAVGRRVGMRAEQGQGLDMGLDLVLDGGLKEEKGVVSRVDEGMREKGFGSRVDESMPILSPKRATIISRLSGGRGGSSDSLDPIVINAAVGANVTLLGYIKGAPTSATDEGSEAGLLEASLALSGPKMPSGASVDLQFRNQCAELAQAYLTQGTHVKVFGQYVRVSTSDTNPKVGVTSFQIFPNDRSLETRQRERTDQTSTPQHVDHARFPSMPTIQSIQMVQTPLRRTPFVKGVLRAPSGVEKPFFIKGPLRAFANDKLHHSLKTQAETQIETSSNSRQSRFVKGPLKPLRTERTDLAEDPTLKASSKTPSQPEVDTLKASTKTLSQPEHPLPQSSPTNRFQKGPFKSQSTTTAHPQHYPQHPNPTPHPPYPQSPTLAGKTPNFVKGPIRAKSSGNYPMHNQSGRLRRVTSGAGWTDTDTKDPDDQYHHHEHHAAQNTTTEKHLIDKPEDMGDSEWEYEKILRDIKRGNPITPVLVPRKKLDEVIPGELCRLKINGDDISTSQE
ncbi:hypothetical protein AAMO2058_001124700 [Amorphochlora amoebiformis]